MGRSCPRGHRPCGWWVSLAAVVPTVVVGGSVLPPQLLSPRLWVGPALAPIIPVVVVGPGLTAIVPVVVVGRPRSHCTCGCTPTHHGRVCSGLLAMGVKQKKEKGLHIERYDDPADRLALLPFV